MSSGRMRRDLDKKPTFVRWVMKLPFIKTEKQANYTLVGIAVVALLLSFYFFASALGGPSPAPADDIPPEEVQEL